MRLLITGATGSLGVALMSYITREHSDWEITAYSRDEVKQSALRGRFPNVRFLLGDIRDLDWLRIVMRSQTACIHTAAYKQVPSAEANAGEAIETNVIGSRNVARAAVEAQVGTVVGISTDKACAPVNCYGETKALMEKLFIHANDWSDYTDFRLVRYGNVLGSRGSVIPLFREQARSGYITVTDPTMTRFWMTLDDAVELVMYSLCTDHALLPQGSILVPCVGASTMGRLAHAVAPEAEVRVIGTRPGEKHHEALVHSGESMGAEMVLTPIGRMFRVHSAQSKFRGTFPQGWEYTSDKAHQLSDEALAEMVAQA